MILVIYDNAGTIFDMKTGAYAVPAGGINYIEVETIPEGKYIASVDVSGETHVPVYADIPKSETQLLQEQINDLTVAMAAMMGGE